MVRWETTQGAIFDSKEEAQEWEAKESKLSLIRQELSRDPDEEEIYYFIKKYTKGWK